MNTYFEIVDRLTSELERRKIAYDEINNNFGFLFNLTKLNSGELTNCANSLHKKYKTDLPSSFANECFHFKGYLISKSKTQPMTILEMQQFIIENEVQKVFPYIEIATRMFLSIPASNCSAKRSFSALKRIKNYLRSKLNEELLNDYAILHIEAELVKTIEFDEVIEKFASTKARKKCI